MLPILRILPVGGVFLAILLLVLALKAPGERALPSPTLTLSGTQADPHEDPQWRQVAIQAALRRANELIRLRDLPDTPMRSEAPAPVEVPAPVVESAPPAQEPAASVEQPKIAGLPAERSDADPDSDSITGTIEDSPGATIPVEIGAASSFEIPIVLPEERPAIIRAPQQGKSSHESRRKRSQRNARAKAQQPQTPPPRPSLFEELFGGRQSPTPTVKSGESLILNQSPAHRSDGAY